MRIFDYLYYRVYFIYKTKWKDSTPGAYATSLLTLLQTIYLVALPMFIYELFTNNKITQSKIFYLIFFIVFFLFNLFRYQRVIVYQRLAERWDNEEKGKRKKRGILTVIMIVLSLILFLGLATILGKINRGEMEPIF